MKRKLLRTVIMGWLLCAAMAISMIPALAAEGPATYVLSFRPGANGSFSEGAEGYLSGFGSVQRTAVGNLFVEVPAGSAFPAGIVSYLTADDGYYYRAGLDGETVNGDGNYVAEYGVLSGEGIRYTVEFVDAATGAVLAEPYQGYANAGDTISFTARAVTGFAADAASKSITVADGAVLQFRYTGGAETTNRTEYVYGANTEVTETVVTADNTTPTVTPAPATTETPAEASAAPVETTVTPAEVPEDQGEAAVTTPENQDEVIPDAEVPLAGGDGETIPDAETPLASGTSGFPPIAAAGIGVGALIAVLAAVLLLRKKITR